MSDDPFAPLPSGRKPRLRIVGRSDEWTPVVPAPADAPTAPAEHPQLGAPSGRWIYRDAGGALLGYVLRFETPDGKEIRPLTLWRGEKGLGWRWMSWPEPRPLFGLDQLVARPSAPVLVCEGEKSCDAAAALAPDHVAITAPGGARAAKKADWAALRDRSVTIWPDADAPGRKYAEAVAEACTHLGVKDLRIAEPPSNSAEGWDAADAKTDGWTPTRTAEFLQSATPVGPSPRAGRNRASKPGAEATEQRSARRGVGAILSLVEEAGVAFWHDAAQNGYATVQIRGHRENYRIESREFQRFVAARAYEQGFTPPSSNTLSDAQRVFLARALHEGPERRPFKRIGERSGLWYMDLGDDRWRVVEIGPDGWAIRTDHDLPIVRSQAMRPLPDPEVTDQGIGLLRGFVNAPDDAFKMLVAWLLAAFCPQGPYPIAIVNGEQGSAKSTLCRCLRNLVDPNVAPLRAMPKDEVDLLVGAIHSHVLALDNVSRITGEMSDALCRVATGAGLSARAKFTDGEEFVVFSKNPIILNGIPSLASRPDLASRSLVVRLDPISEESRKSEAEHEAQWAAAVPRILGILFDVLSSALRKLPETRLPRASRMADFERLIEAASPALEWEPGEFAAIYRANQAELDAETIEGNPVAEAIVDFIDAEHPEGWEGSAARLLETLQTRVSEAVRRSRSWPETVISLGIHLSRLTPVLRRNGLILERKHSGSRWIAIRPIPPTTRPSPNRLQPEAST